MAMHNNEISLGAGQVNGWQARGVAFELHRGQPHAIPKHAHDTYQIGMTTRDPGEYLCDGKAWYAPPGSIVLFHPGQVHSAPRASVRSCSAISRLIFVDIGKMREVAAMVAEHDGGQPHFDDLVITDEAFIARFLAMHKMAGAAASALEKDSGLLSALAQLVLRFGSVRARPENVQGNAARTRAIREYVQDRYAENITLAELSDVARVSPYYLNRIFASEVGMPPHAFQTQVRVERAKSLLLGGMSVTDAALETGFFDQSHFTRHFRRIVGVPPKRYVSCARH
ncbi:AraC family transcriptional regulator [Pollutimonas bauzanensis]|uniref:Transcriptional regulator, AraC family n=1 Tax=Pollutimonas bauzanensis TaxID=658167 RepID=A0A1M5TJS7_9BURK|nr:AraC family transcriptional regulator [Pollutimonas bauzanensis]SHH51017.1 transcriptional regulator, AraC family [Pollutimonas bauzanensis]